MKLQSATGDTTEKGLSLDYDLVIVGGGIVGATLGASLKDSGLRIGIIESQSLEQVVARERAYALSLMSGRIFQGIGIWERIFPSISKFSHIRLSDGDDQGVVKFEPTDLETDFLGYVGEHRVILTALQDFIATCSNVTWLCPTEVLGVDYQAHRAIVTLTQDGQEQQIMTKLVVGADGPRSRVRQFQSIKTQGWKYWQSCVTFTIKHRAERNDIAFERFWPTGPMGILPLPGNRCQIVWTAPHQRAKELQQLDEQEFISLVEQHTGGLLGRLELVSDRLVFPVQLMQSKNYVKPRLALIGDAAHCCHPVGGQGLNLGIRDAAALSQILKEAMEKGEDIGELAVLKRYEKWRKPENLAILGITDFLDRIFSNNWLPLVILRRLGLLMMRQIHPLKVLVLQIMTGLRGKKPEISFQ